MEELRKQGQVLRADVDAAMQQLRIAEIEQERAELEVVSRQPDFWQDSSSAQTTMQRLAKLQSRVEPWLSLQKKVAELQELLELDDPGLEAELGEGLEAAANNLESLKDDLKFAGPYDDHDVIITLSAGAGGTDAQDWTQMLFRMYVRWGENNGYSVTTVDESAGEEAGLKSATIGIDGPFAYGKLKGEHGVHRLVRLSPFNSDNLRQTSFAKVEVMPKIDAPDELALDEKDLKIDVFRSGGHGGQSVNTTDSAVRVSHLPTGITVAIQNERSQLQNKETALTIVRSRLAQLQLEQHAEQLSELKGPNEQAAWGNQIRSYVLHPYKQVKDLRTRYETSDVDGVLNGNLDGLIGAYLEFNLSDQ